MHYRIEIIGSGPKAGQQFAVTAPSYEAAASLAAKKINPGKRGLRALRITGSAKLSGIFQGFLPVKGGGVNATGPQFHVM